MSDNGLSINRVVIHNFMNHSHSDLHLIDFNSCLIVGREKFNYRRSNGAGKTTIFHAINYGFFGVYTTDTINEIVREGEDQCSVIIEFNIDSVDYKIERKRSVKSNKSQLMMYEKKGDDWENQDHRKDSNTTDALNKLLKISYEAWNNSVLFSQGSLSALAEGTEAEKRKILKEPLNLAIYSEYEKIIKNKKTKVEKELDAVLNKISYLGNPNQDIEDLNKEIKITTKNIKSLNDKKENIDNEIKILRSSLSQSESLLNSDDAKVSSELVYLNKKNHNLNKELDDLNKKSKEYNNLINESKKSCDLLKKQLADLEVQRSELSLVKNKSEQEIEQEIKELSDKESKGNKYIASLEHKLEIYSKKLPEGAHCESCFNELNDEYREKITNENKNKAIETKDLLDRSYIKLKKINENKSNLYNELKDISKHQSNLNRLTSEIASKLKEVASSDDISTRYRKMLSDNLEKVSKLEKDIDLNIKSQELLKEKIKNFDISTINSEIIKINKEINEKESFLNKVNKEIIECNTSLGISKDRKSKRESDLTELISVNITKEKLDRKLKTHNKVVKAFSASGIPSLIIHTVLDDLQIESNNVLQDFRPELFLKFSIEKNDKDILDIKYLLNGKNRSYNQLSGGQKMYIAFALKLGLSTVIQKRMGINIQFLGLDEVDQPIDDDGRDAFIDIIKKCQNKYKIMVITHNNRLKDKFSHAILVENDGDNGAVAKVVTDW